MYRLVWAAEAILSCAEAQQLEATAELTTATPRALTFGVPSVEAALLVQAGLPSRRMAINLLDHFPAQYESFQELRIWLSQIQNEVDRNLWDDSERHEVWEYFISEWETFNEKGEWESTEVRRSVTWTTDPLPEAGRQVQLITLDNPDRTVVAGDELQTLGQLDQPYLEVSKPGQIRAVVGEHGDYIVINRFGP